MEEESMEVFCEAVPAEDEGNRFNLGNVGSSEIRVEYAHGEDCDEEQVEKDISFETEVNTGNMEIFQNDISESNEDAISLPQELCAIPNTDQTYSELDATDPEIYTTETEISILDGDPTETLQKVLMDTQSHTEIIPIKKEPFEAEHVKDTSIDVENTQAMLISNDPHPVTLVKKHARRPKKSAKVATEKPGKPSKPSAPSSQSHITRSGRKSTFITMQQKRMKGKPVNTTKVAPANKPKNVLLKKPPSRTNVENVECLVCSASCQVTKKREIPSFPFCNKCKKAYSSHQLATDTKQNRRARNKICPKGGKCIVDHRFPKQWCPICHFKKFSKILSNQNVEFDFENDEFRDMHRPKIRTEGVKGGSLVYDALQNSSSVLLEKMSRKELADYGIEMEQHEPMDFELFPVNSSRKSAIKKRHLKEHESVVKKKKYSNEDIANVQTTSLKEQEKISGSKNGSKATKSSPEKPKKGKGKHRKVLMLHTPSSTDTEDETTAEPYSLPAVNIGSTTVSKAASRPPSGPNSQVSATTPYSGGNRKILEETSDMENHNNYTEVLESIKVYVFTCGHACGLCNSVPSKEWLKESGFYTSKPVSFPLSTSHTSTSVTSSSNPKRAVKNTPEGKQKKLSISKSVTNPKASDKNVKTQASSSALPQEVLQTLLESAKSVKATPPVTTVSSNSNNVLTTVAPTVVHNQQSTLPTTSSLSHNTPPLPKQNTNIIQSMTTTTMSVNNKVVTTVPNTVALSFPPTLLSALENSQSNTKSVQLTTQVSSSGTVTIPVVQNISSEMPVIVQDIEKPAVVVQNINQTVIPRATTPAGCPSQSASVQFAPTSFQNLLELQKKGYVLTPVTNPVINSTSVVSQASVTTPELTPNVIIVSKDSLPPSTSDF